MIGMRGGHVRNFQEAPPLFVPRDMLDFVHDQDIDAALLQIQRNVHKQVFFVVVLHVGGTAFHHDPLQEGLGRPIPDRRIYLDDRNPISILFDHWKMVRR